MSRRGWLLFAAMAVVWGVPYLLIKVAVGQLTPPSLVFIRTAIGALVLVPVAFARGGVRPLLPHWRVVAVYTAIEIGLPWLLLSDAERKLSSSLAGLLVATVPLIGAVLALLTGAADRMRTRQVLGLVLGFCGVAALVGLDLTRGDLAAAGELAVVCVCYAVGPVIISRRLAGIDSVLVVAASLALAALAYAPAGILQRPATVPSASVIAAVAALGVVCTALAFVLFFALIAEAGPVRATLITYFNPAVALLLGVLLLHEPFTVGAGLGLVLILGGSFLATRRHTVPATAIPAPAAVQG
ncbi:MAG: DMT family transporter [Candidatus Dormibacteraeota bacterium]|nr:DMT family transporter [Candidatus Dormibacteraeota bacterium]MBV9524188.1 DMT family transporter [Candidatus Dormibacteraeota bacterium]